jgi:glycosyltransferase involved in cell wall biosynthesis
MLNKVLKGKVDNKKVLLIGDIFWPSVGGIEVFLGELGAGLVGEGFIVDVATRPYPGRDSMSYRGMRIVEFPNFGDVDPAKRGGISDIVHLLTHGNYDATIILAHPAPLVFCLLALPRPRPRIIYLPLINRENLDSYLDEGTLPLVMRHISAADEIVSITESSCDVQLLRTAGIPSRYIPHALKDAPMAQSYREHARIPDGLPLFVMVANYWTGKNHLGLIEVMRTLPGEWRLEIIGNPHRRDYFAKVKGAADCDPRIVVHGLTPPDVTAAAIRDADLLLLASKGECCPMVVIQAMRHGTPWVATPQCGSVRDQAGGIVVELEHFVRVVEALMRMPDHRKTLGQLGRAHWQDCFNPEQIIPAFVALLNGEETLRDFSYPATLRRKNKGVVLSILRSAALEGVCSCTCGYDLVCTGKPPSARRESARARKRGHGGMAGASGNRLIAFPRPPIPVIEEPGVNNPTFAPPKHLHYAISSPS